MKLLLVLLSAGKLGKLLVSGGSMLLSVVAHAFIYGWRYAAGFVGLIFLHEMGHINPSRWRRYLRRPARVPSAAFRRAAA